MSLLSVEFSLGRGSFNYKGLVSVICSNYTHYYTPTLYKCYDNGVEGRVVNTIQLKLTQLTV